MITTINKLEQLSTQGVGIQNLWEKAKQINENREDCLVKMGDFSFSDEAKVSLKGVSFDMTEYALSQQCAKIKVPVTYIKNCFNQGMGHLASRNMNDWINVYKDKALLVRTYDGVIRGILSDRYSKLDSQDVLEMLGEHRWTSQLKVVGSYLSEDRFHVRMVVPEKLSIAQDDLYVGLQIDNSDIGMASLSVKLLVYKQVCTNGLVVGKEEGVLFGRRHIGITFNDFREQICFRMNSFGDLTEKVVAIINQNKAVRLNSLEIGKRLNRVKQVLGLGKEELEKLNDLINDRYGMTNWGLINGLTEIAQDYTLDKRIEIEKYASHLLY